MMKRNMDFAGKKSILPCLRQYKNTSTMPTNKPLAETGYEKYAGNPFLTYDSLTIAVLLLCFIYQAGKAIVQHHFNNNEYIFAFPVFCLLLYFMLGYTFYYFMLSEEYLVIKNHRLTWKKFVYPISDIEAITYVTVYPTSGIRNGTYLGPLLAIR